MQYANGYHLIWISIYDRWESVDICLYMTQKSNKLNFSVEQNFARFQIVIKNSIESESLCVRIQLYQYERHTLTSAKAGIRLKVWMVTIWCHQLLLNVVTWPSMVTDTDISNSFFVRFRLVELTTECILNESNNKNVFCCCWYRTQKCEWRMSMPLITILMMT